MGRPSRTPLPVALLLALVCACSTPGPDDAAESPGPSTPNTQVETATTAPAPTLSPSEEPTRRTEQPPPGTVPPPWLGERVLPRADDGYGVVRATPPALRHRRFTLPDPVAALPGRGFAARITSPAPGHVIARSSWRPGCPVPRGRLSWLRVTFRGFDGERHTGEALVHTEAAEDLRGVFRRLWRADFPIEEMRVTRANEVDAPPTGDGNNTTAFVCRATTGTSGWSQHAHGLAIDVNPFQNPYRRGDRVLPELASSYLDRGDVRPGMITPDGPVVRAFAAIGWGWGGAWRSLVDYQHFSRSGT